MLLYFSKFIFASWTDSLGTAGLIVVAVLLVVASLVAWGLNLIALPGNWLCVLLIAGYAWLGPGEGRLSIGVGAVIGTFVLALIGEGIEFLAGAAGARKAGASKKSTLYSIIGSVAGAILGGIVGVPIPVVGSALAAILFGGIGAAAGAMYGEWTDGRKWRENWSIGHATFWGRTFGVLGKMVAGAVIVAVTVCALLL